MGITLHYSGELISPSLIPSITEEMQALSEESGWIFNKIGPDTFRPHGRESVCIEGLLVMIHPNAEPLNFVFDKKGVLVNFLYLLANTRENSEDSEKAESTRILVLDEDGQVGEAMGDAEEYHNVGLYTASTKTQFAGPGAHIALCKLLRYLQKKYFKRLIVRDEGTYWELNDLYQLSQRMQFLDAKINQLGEYWATRPPDKPVDEMDPESILADLREFLRKIRGLE